jgi:L-iditol 2-dehydrogenase
LPYAHQHCAAALELSAKEVFATAEDFVNEAQGRYPLVIEAANSPFGFRDAVRASRIGGRIVLAGIPDGDAWCTFRFGGTQARPQDQVRAPGGQ